ncbi:hypothetical protein [Haloplanus aerogenes]|nr:hypothetical protein [Haloplanus aerogenes]RMB25062.1 hypothetical protein ATH50_0145 [Haloplanus aerogenes]
MTGVAGCAEQSDGSDFAGDFGIDGWEANTTIGPEVEVETFECHRDNNIE